MPALASKSEAVGVPKRGLAKGPGERVKRIGPLTPGAPE
jgi:hypothetical protein